MKKLKYILGAACLSIVTVFTGCDDFKLGTSFLEKPEGDDLNKDSVFGKKIYAEQALAEAYHALPDFLPAGGRLSWSMLEMLTDLGDHVKGWPSYYNPSPATTDASGAPYRLDDTENPGVGPMKGIRNAYIYIENVDRVPDMTIEKKIQTKAEARLLIAYHYSQMLRYYGGMPWIEKSFSANDNLSSFKRMTLEEMVGKIVSLCDESARDLPWFVPEEEDGHLTKAAAIALKQRVLEFVASPLFNADQPYEQGEAAAEKIVWFGNYDKNRWLLALEAGQEFLEENKKNGNYYRLYSEGGSPRLNYRGGYANRNNHEILISSRRYNVMNKNYKCLSQLRYGTTAPTQNYTDMFEKVDGTSFDWNNQKDVDNMFFEYAPVDTVLTIKDKNGKKVDKDTVLCVRRRATRDPRLYETIGVNGDNLYGSVIIPIYEINGKNTCKQWPYVGGTGYVKNGIAIRKFVRDWNKDLNGSFYTCPLLRLPEVYLTIAESMNELGLASTKDKFGNDAYDYINIVRSRVGMPPVSPKKVKPGDELREYILDERAREFGFEEVRYFDLVRYKRSDKFCESLYRLVTTKNDDVNTKLSIPFKHKRNYKMHQPRKFTQKDSWNNKRFLLPLSNVEINKKYGLIQNPGWD